MAQNGKGRVWQKCRLVLRRLRIAALLLLAILLACLLYLNLVGLPGFLKKPLLNKLHARGLDVQFTRVRWRLAGGIVMENVRLAPTNAPSGPLLTLKEMQVQLNYSALFKFQLRASELVMRQGRLTWIVLGTNGATRELSMDNIQADLRMLPGDLWELGLFKAQFAGADLQVSGAITNASALREWKFFKGREPEAPGIWERRLQQVAERLERIHFASAPQLRIDLRGDARELQSFGARLALNAPDAETPWGTLRNGALLIWLQPTANAESHAVLTLLADQAQTEWANATNLALKIDLLSTNPDTNLVRADLELTTAGVDSKWGGAARTHLAATWLHAMTNYLPVAGRAECQMENARTQWGSAGQLQFAGMMSTSTNEPVATDESWAWWARLAPYAIDWECRLGDVDSPRFTASNLLVSAEWRAPELLLRPIGGTLYRGKFDAEASLDVATRYFQFFGSSDFDARKVAPLLTEKGRRWIEQFTWTAPPIINARGSVTLPAWTNLSRADWRGEVKPTIRLDGDVRTEKGAFRDVPFSYALTHFSYSNLVWRIPDLVATRPEGRVDLAYEGSEATRDYYFRLRSTLNPQVLRPLFDTNQQRVFDVVAFTAPPVIEGEVWGRWEDPDRIGARAQVAVTNFSLRGEAAGNLQTAVEYTNRILTLTEPRLQRGTQNVAAASVVVDFDAEKVYLTNGVGTCDPGALTRAIGPKIAKLMEPYHFLQPPFARVRGTIPLRNHRDADLHFEVSGGPFAWWKLNVPRIEGRVDWVGDRLTLRNVQADFYQGRSLANVDFDFSPRLGADFTIDFSATDADLHPLMADLSGKTNRLEGRLTGRFFVTRANTTDWRTVFGRGNFDLHDGLIWDFPIFGIFSSALDAIIPDLGSSRAREGTGNFIITNGVVHFDDLEIRTSMMRMQYRGGVDLEGRVDARVQAELMRNTPVIGRLLSFLLWPIAKVFEYRISGTLQDPKSEPVSIVPKILLAPFHPFSGSKTGPESPDASRTNAPPRVP